MVNDIHCTNVEKESGIHLLAAYQKVDMPGKNDTHMVEQEAHTLLNKLRWGKCQLVSSTFTMRKWVLVAT